MKTAIYGPGGFGRELISVASHGHDEICFVSDNPSEIGQRIEGVHVYSLDELVEIDRKGAEEHARRPPPEYDKPKPYRPVGVVIAVADASTRRALAEKVRAAGLRAGSAWSQSTIIGPGVELGEGSVLCHQTIITASAKIGRHFHANIYSYVAHDCVVGDFVTLAPKACINGNVILEDDVYVGTGAILKQGTPAKPLRIGRGAVIGMGAVVTKDVESGAVVIGNPARPR